MAERRRHAVDVEVSKQEEPEVNFLQLKHCNPELNLASPSRFAQLPAFRVAKMTGFAILNSLLHHRIFFRGQAVERMHGRIDLRVIDVAQSR